MSCARLRQDLDVSCQREAKKYNQQVVLINRDDVLNKLVSLSRTLPDGTYVCTHRVAFNLKENARGYRFTGNEQGAAMYGSFDKSQVEGIPQYSHTVNILASGVSEAVKCILKQLDSSDYFAALQYRDGKIEIYGFDYGLTTTNYSYNPQNNDGGGILSLRSLPESLEDEPPYMYDGNPEDFDNNFEDVIFNPSGDFNDDFNDDFDNTIGST